LEEKKAEKAARITVEKMRKLIELKEKLVRQGKTKAEAAVKKAIMKLKGLLGI